MSWSITIPETTKLDAARDIAAAIAAYDFGGDSGAEMNYQARRAGDAAFNLLPTVGTDTATLSIHLGGHANPGNQVRDGWANDSVTVNVTVVRDVVPEPVPEEAPVPEAAPEPAEASPEQPAETEPTAAP